MWPQTLLSQRLNLSCPIIQAPMAGGATTPELVAAVSNAGGLGSFAAGYLAATQITEQIRRIRSLTDKPFAVNLFMPEHPFELPEKVDRVQAIMSSFREELGISAAPPVEPPEFQAQIQAILAAQVPVFSFTFGLLSHELIQQFKAQKTVLIGTATNLREAEALQATGVDFIVAQGSEAGGHRGTFSGGVETGMIGTMVLVPQLRTGLTLPVIAAGGIMEGRSIAAALALGATAVQMGTAFLSCTESGIPPVYRQALLEQSGDTTTLTRAFSGKWARGIRNRFITDMKHFDDLIPDYPVQNSLTRDIRQAAMQQERSEFMSLWAGQGVMFSRTLSVAELIEQLGIEMTEAVHQLSR